jgi:hypothetical protein
MRSGTLRIVRLVADGFLGQSAQLIDERQDLSRSCSAAKAEANSPLAQSAGLIENR